MEYAVQNRHIFIKKHMDYKVDYVLVQKNK